MAVIKIIIVAAKERAMSKNAVKAKAKKQKKELSLKKAKQKKIIIAAVCVLLAAAVVSGIALISANTEKPMEIYSYLGQTVQLFPDGKFAAVLAHNVRKNGTYAKTTENGRTAISFNVNGNIEIGWINNNNLHIPGKWDDGHGHGNVFPKVK